MDERKVEEGEKENSSLELLFTTTIETPKKRLEISKKNLIL